TANSMSSDHRGVEQGMRYEPAAPPVGAPSVEHETVVVTVDRPHPAGSALPADSVSPRGAADAEFVFDLSVAAEGHAESRSPDPQREVHFLEGRRRKLRIHPLDSIPDLGRDC